MKPPSEPGLRKSIRELIARAGGAKNEDLIEELILGSLKAGRDVPHRGDAKMIRTAMRELSHAFKTFAPYADRRKVTIFGSARTVPQKPEYQQAVEFARQIAQAGFMVITGAGPGIMQAGHEGAGLENSFGINIQLPWEQSPNPVIEKDSKLITFKYFFTRKLAFIRHSDAIVLLPGGFGTLDEGYEALTLMQIGKSRLMPLVLIDKKGGTYWKTWDHHVREHLLRDKLISPEDVTLYQMTDDPGQAVKWITRFYRNYHSSRFVGSRLVIRLKNAPSASALAALNEDYADILASGKIEPATPAREEVDDEDCASLPRIALVFDRKHYGRLRQLIDTLNSY
jgi:uncharacterized protein (TIGR00730 family)